MAHSHPAHNLYLQESPSNRGARTDAAEGGNFATMERDKTDVRRCGAASVEATTGADVPLRGCMFRVRDGLLGDLLMSEAWLLQLTGTKIRRLGIRISKFDRV